LIFGIWYRRILVEEDYFQAASKLIVRIIGYICGGKIYVSALSVSAPKSPEGDLKSGLRDLYWLCVPFLGVESNLKPL